MEINRLPQESTLESERNNLGTGNTKYTCNTKTGVCGSSNGVLITTYILIILPSLIYAIIVIPTYSTTGIIILYIFFVLTFLWAIFSLIDVSTTNPGFIPHEKDLTKEEFMKGDHKIEIKGQIIELKFCETCKIIRPPRSFHCGVCGNCVRIHDHHCPFVGNCIGERNIHKFFLFLFSVFLHCSNVCIGTSYIFGFKRAENKLMDYQDWISIIIFVISFLFFITTLVMFAQQIFLISYGKTTNECLRKQYKEFPFDEGCGRNWKKACLCDDAYSKLDGKAILENYEINA